MCVYPWVVVSAVQLEIDICKLKLKKFVLEMNLRSNKYIYIFGMATFQISIILVYICVHSYYVSIYQRL